MNIYTNINIYVHINHTGSRCYTHIYIDAYEYTYNTTELPEDASFLAPLLPNVPVVPVRYVGWSHYDPPPPLPRAGVGEECVRLWRQRRGMLVMACVYACVCIFVYCIASVYVYKYILWICVYCVYMYMYTYVYICIYIYICIFKYI